MPPRVLFIDHTGALGGAELYLLDVVRRYEASARVITFEEGPFCERLRADGLDVQVAAAPPALLQVEKGGALRQGLRAVPGVLRLAGRLARTARSFDVIYANSQKALVIGALAGLFARRPVIWNLHDMLTADHFSAVNRRLGVLWANHLADRVVVNSEATRRAFVESGGDEEKTALVYNGIDAAAFEDGSGEEARCLRQNLGIEKEAPVVGVFSRLAEWKGQHVLLDALARLPQQVHAVLVGEALFEADERYARRLRRRARKSELNGRVHFLGFRDDVPALMRGCDVVAHTSVAPEPFGRVIVEGMLAGCPVVAARAGGAREIVDHRQTGLLVPPGDAAALARALRRLLECPREAQALARRGRGMAKKRFSVEHMRAAVHRHVRAVASPP